MKRSLLPIIFVLAALLMPTGAHAATTGTLSLTVSGAPKKSKKAKRTVTVRAIDLRTGMLALSATSKKANPAIKLAPGVYVVAVRTIDFPGTASEGTSGVAVVKAGKKTKKKLRVKPLKKKKKKGKKSAFASAKKGIWAPESEYAGLRVIGVDPRLAIKGLDEYPSGLEIDSVITAPLTEGCSNDDPKVRVVEIRRRAEVIEEIERGDDPRFDKSTAVQRGHLLKERELVKGGATVANGRIEVLLRLVDVKTGEVTAAGSATGDASSAESIIAAVEAAGRALMDQLCGGKVNVTFTGSNTYSRDEGSSAGDNEDHVRASYNWSTTYHGVNIAGDGSLVFSTASEITGNSYTDGRYGAEGPGNYHCEAAVVTYNPQFAMLRVKRTGGTAQFVVDPYTVAQGDFMNKTCTGLPGPPFASFSAFGAHAANQATVEFSVADLSAAGSLTFNVAPKASPAPDCSDVVSGYEMPCTQSQSWSGTVTVTKAQ